MSAAIHLRILNVHLENFRNYTDHTWTFDTRTLLIGENGTGKSTIIDAISWCLRARCRGVDGKGAGQRDLIGDAGDRMAVTVTMDGIGPVRRTYDRAGNTTVTVKDPVAKLGTTDAALSACLYGRTFFQLHHAEAKQLLLQVLDVRVEPSQLPGLKLKAPATLDELDAYYQTAFQNRAATKKTLAAVHVPDAPIADIGGWSVETLQVEVGTLQTRYQDWVMEHSGKSVELAGLKKNLVSLSADIVNRDQVQGSLQTHSDSHTQANIDLADANKALAQAEELTAEPVRELQTQTADLLVLAKRLEAHDPERGCVLSASIPCLTKAKDFEGYGKQIATAVKGLEKRIKAGETRAHKIGAAQQQVKDAQRHVEYHRTQILECQRKLKAHDHAQLQLGVTSGLVNTLIKEVDELARAIKDVTEDMKAKQAKIQGAAAYQTAQRNRQAALDRKALLEKELQDLDAQVTMLGPNGVRLQALTTAVQDFTFAINAALHHFGFQLQIQPDPWMVQLKKGDGPWRPFELLSDGEKLWTGLGFQLALAIQSGLDCCCIDAAEVVVGQRRAKLTQLLMGAPVGQIVIAMAKSAQDPDPEIEGLQVIRITDPVAAPV